MNDEADANEELAQTARAIARLLTQERYDEAELAELDVRAKELRARIRARQSRSDSQDWLVGRT